MEVNPPLLKLELTLFQIDLAFQNVPKFNQQVDFKVHRDTMKQTHESLKKQVIDTLQATEQVRELLEEKKISQSRKGTITLESDIIPEEKEIKHRRRSKQIEKVYKCPCNHCERCYGSEVSLSYHMKMKHGVTYSRKKFYPQAI